ncbi:MAG: transaldolase [Galactobacter sp.]
MSAHTSALAAAGVSLWLDDLSRERLNSGSLAALVASSDVSGVTTNPSIFAAALKDGASYAEQVSALAAAGADVDSAVFEITTDDVAAACDVMAPVAAATDGVDGRVSIEVDPRFAHDTAATVAQAKELAAKVDRSNVLIKIPATVEGLPAITEVLAAGISVNVTLIFDLERYRGVLNAYQLGLERAREAGHDLSSIHSVASFFVSRVDAEIDARLDAIGTEAALALRGKAALANARLAYQVYEEAHASERWFTLASAGARPQRALWASTGVKNPAYPDTLYVDGLVAPDTVNTMPQATLDAVADHGGDGSETVRGTYEESNAVLDALSGLGIDYDEVVSKLETEGVEKFIVSWNELLESLSASLQEAKNA